MREISYKIKVYNSLSLEVDSLIAKPYLALIVVDDQTGRDTLETSTILTKEETEELITTLLYAIGK